MEVKTIYYNGQVLSIAVPSEVFNTSNYVFSKSHILVQSQNVGPDEITSVAYI